MSRSSPDYPPSGTAESTVHLGQRPAEAGIGVLIDSSSIMREESAGAMETRHVLFAAIMLIVAILLVGAIGSGIPQPVDDRPPATSS